MRLSITRTIPAITSFLMVPLLLATGPTPIRAQPGVEPLAARANENIFQVLQPRSELQMTEQFSHVVECPNRITRVDGFDPDIVTVTALTPNQVRVRGERSGVTSVVLTDEFENAYTVDIFVTGDVRHLQAYLSQLFPEASVHAVKLQEGVVLRGVVTEPDHITEIVDVAMEFFPKVLNQMRVGGVHQVQLNVKVMEVARSKVRQLGFNFLLRGEDGFIHSAPGSIVPLADLVTPIGGPPGVTLGASALADSTVTFAITGASAVFNGFLEALREESLLKILAEPKLVTTSGRPASLLSGGEFPILVPQSLGTVTIEWREFGVRMEAVPVVLGNGRLRLDVAPEVSERDFSNAVNINGLVVPGITTRRVNTQVEMRFGDTLMIGGLISTRKAGTTSKVPFLGELPWIGAAFSRKRFDNSETELLIVVTPHMVAPLRPDQVPPCGPGEFTDDPTDRELYLDGMIEIPKYGSDCGNCQPGFEGGFIPGGPLEGGPGMYPAPGGTPAMPVESMPAIAPPAFESEDSLPTPPAPQSTDTVSNGSAHSSARRVTSVNPFQRRALGEVITGSFPSANRPLEGQESGRSIQQASHLEAPQPSATSPR